MVVTRGTRPHRFWRGVAVVVGGIVLLVPLLFPIYWILSSSLQNLGTIYAKAPELFPTHVYGENYRLAWNNVIGNIGTSLVVALLVVAFSWVIGVPAAYALRRRGKFTTVVLFVMLVTQMVPGISISMALYNIFHGWGLLESYAGLVLADAAGAIPFVILVVRAFMAGLPEELFDAAEVDGAGTVRSFLRIAVPLSIPSIMTVGLFAFLGAWGDYVNALTLDGAGGPQPLTLGLYKFVQQHSTDLGGIFAAAMLAAVPTTILLFVGQRWIRGGLKAGALKG